MTANEQKAAAQKGETHDGCGGKIFTSSEGRVCLLCGELCGNQRIPRNILPQRANNSGGITGAMTSRPSHANSTGRIV
jgi:hypothetical protein